MTLVRLADRRPYAFDQPDDAPVFHFALKDRYDEGTSAALWAQCFDRAVWAATTPNRDTSYDEHWLPYPEQLAAKARRDEDTKAYLAEEIVIARQDILDAISVLPDFARAAVWGALRRKINARLPAVAGDPFS
jgi:hypothetical protein